MSPRKSHEHRERLLGEARRRQARMFPIVARSNPQSISHPMAVVIAAIHPIGHDPAKRSQITRSFRLSARVVEHVDFGNHSLLMRRRKFIGSEGLPGGVTLR